MQAIGHAWQEAARCWDYNNVVAAVADLAEGKRRAFLAHQKQFASGVAELLGDNVPVYYVVKLATDDSWVRGAIRLDRGGMHHLKRHGFSFLGADGKPIDQPGDRFCDWNTLSFETASTTYTLRADQMEVLAHFDREFADALDSGKLVTTELSLPERRRRALLNADKIVPVMELPK